LAEEHIHRQQGEAARVLSEIIVVPVRTAESGTVERVVADLASSVEFHINVAVVRVNGEEAAVLRNEEEARELLAEILQGFVHSDWVVFDNFFRDHVDVVNDFRALSDRMGPQTARMALLSTEVVECIHTVVGGENLTVIRQRYGMSEAEIMRMNPGINPALIRPGQEINIMRPQPLLTAVTVVQQEREEFVRFSVEEHPSPNHPLGHRESVQSGRDGLHLVIEHLFYENGVFESRREVHRQPVPGQEPVNEIVIVGTRQ